jgi:hypothetical protein
MAAVTHLDRLDDVDEPHGGVHRKQLRLVFQHPRKQFLISFLKPFGSNFDQISIYASPMTHSFSAKLKMMLKTSRKWTDNSCSSFLKELSLQTLAKLHFHRF